MKQIFDGLIAAFTLLIASGGTSLAQDKQEGIEAWENGDYTRAVPLLYPLAIKGNARAQFYLGASYDIGWGIAQNHSEAAKWYRRSAEQGFAKAQNNLGDLHLNGRGVIQDFIYAHMWFNIAASQGNESGKHNIGVVEQRLTASQIAQAQKLARECVRKQFKDC